MHHAMIIMMTTTTTVMMMVMMMMLMTNNTMPVLHFAAGQTSCATVCHCACLFITGQH